jgi:hypothetical protein
VRWARRAVSNVSVLSAALQGHGTSSPRSFGAGVRRPPRMRVVTIGGRRGRGRRRPREARVRGCDGRLALANGRRQGGETGACSGGSRFRRDSLRHEGRLSRTSPQHGCGTAGTRLIVRDKILIDYVGDCRCRARIELPLAVHCQASHPVTLLIAPQQHHANFTFSQTHRVCSSRWSMSGSEGFELGVHFCATDQLTLTCTVGFRHEAMSHHVTYNITKSLMRHFSHWARGACVD